MGKDLPTPTELQLLALVVTERNGREAAQLYQQETGAKISYGTLYTTFRRLREKGWVRTARRHSTDARVRCLRITSLGQRRLQEGRTHYGSLSRSFEHLGPARPILE